MSLYNTWAHSGATSVHLYNMVPQALSMEACHVFITTAKITRFKLSAWKYPNSLEKTNGLCFPKTTAVKQWKNFGTSDSYEAQEA